MDMDLHPVARELLTEPNVGYLGYTGLDRRPRVIPIWFAFTGDEIHIASQPGDYKCRSLRAEPWAALTVSTPRPPYHVVSVTGQVAVEVLPEAVRIPLVRALAIRYLGPEGGEAYVARWSGEGGPGPGELLRLRIDRLRYEQV